MTFIEESKHEIFLFTFCHDFELSQHNTCQAFAGYRDRASFSMRKLESGEFCLLSAIKKYIWYETEEISLRKQPKQKQLHASSSAEVIKKKRTLGKGAISGE